MVRTIKAVPAAIFPDDSGKTYVEMAGTSLDEKPVREEYATGSLFLEVDTGDVYAYSETGTEWNKIAELGGGA